MRNIFLIIGFAILVLFLVIVGPFLVIWGLNTLFPALAVPYSWETWAAVVVLNAFFQVSVKVKK
jgi:hypothetical protein